MVFFTLGLCGGKNIFFFFFNLKKRTIDSLGGVLNFSHASLSQCKKLSTKCLLPKAGGGGKEKGLVS